MASPNPSSAVLVGHARDESQGPCTKSRLCAHAFIPGGNCGIHTVLIGNERSGAPEKRVWCRRLSGPKPPGLGLSLRVLTMPSSFQQRWKVTSALLVRRHANRPKPQFHDNVGCNLKSCVTVPGASWDDSKASSCFHLFENGLHANRNKTPLPSLPPCRSI